MRILTLTASMNVAKGGPPRVVAGTAAAMARRGHTVYIASMVEEGISVQSVKESFPELQQPNVFIELFDRSFPRNIGFSRGMRRSLLRKMPNLDIVHIHGIWEQCLAQSAADAYSLGIPVFVSAHGMLDRWSMQQSSFKKWVALNSGTGKMLRNANAIVYGTDDELRECSDVIPDGSGTVVPNGINTELLCRNNLPKQPILTKIFPQVTRWRRTALFFSRVHPKKGLDLLVNAFISIAPRHPECGLLIAGIKEDQAFEKHIRDIISSSGVSEQFAFTTNLLGESARVVFRNTDIFVLPSHQEGFSMAILEAMSLQVPVLITNKCHLDAVAKEWKCGEVVNNSAPCIADALSRFFDLSDAELSRMGDNGRQAVLDNFSWASISDTLEELYREHL